VARAVQRFGKLSEPARPVSGVFFTRNSIHSDPRPSWPSLLTPAR
jgi:hypothetical protein